MHQVALLALGTVFLAAPPVEAGPEVRDIREIVDRAIEAFGVPGAAVAVVRDGEVIYLRGKGVRTRGGAPVTADTVFPLASCSKAFTAAAVARLVDQKKMQWDDPLRKHLPLFRLRDPFADREVTLRDALCHRTGLGPHDALRFASSARAGELLGPSEIVRRLALLEPARPFRSDFEYNNLLYVAAAQAVASASGGTWAGAVKKNFFAPLGMESACASIEEARRSANHAGPHARNREGEVQPLSWDAIRSLEGSDSIGASARDMSRWLLFQLSDGTLDGKRVLSRNQLDEMHRPQVVVRPEGNWSSFYPPQETTLLTYGLGWFVHDYRGHHIVSHGGSLPGFAARVALAPRARVGVAVLTNLGQGERSRCHLPEALTRSILDRLLNLPPLEWNGRFQKEEGRERKEAEERLESRARARHKGTKPSLDLKAYAGTYDSPAYGKVTVRQEGSGLHLSWGRWKLKLGHYHFDTFTASGVPALALWQLDDLVLFRVGRDGKVDRLTFLGVHFRKQ